MKTIIIKSQKEFDALPEKFDQYTSIQIENCRCIVNKMRENSSVVARGNSSVVARGNSSVEAWGNSSVEARENSSVVARENSSVVVRGNSSVVAWGNSSVEAWGNSSVVAWEDSSVVARGNSVINIWSPDVVVQGLFFFSTLVMHFCKCKILKKQSTAQIVHHKIQKITNKIFCEALKKTKDGFILYKSVKPKILCDFYSGSIKYEIGKTIECPDFDEDENRQCGGGLHLSPTKEQALQYSHGTILECAVKEKDFVIFQGDFSKVRCKKIKVLAEAKKYQHYPSARKQIIRVRENWN